MRQVPAPFPAQAGVQVRALNGQPDPLAFERLLATLSERFGEVGESNLQDRAEAVLRQLVDCLGCSRCTFAEFIAGDYLNVVYSVGDGTVAPLPVGRLPIALQWFMADLRSGRRVANVDLLEELPAEAVNELDYCRRTGLRAHLSLPVRLGGRVTSILSFVVMGRPQGWSGETIARLQIIADLLGGAVALARAQSEALQLRHRIWHADRLQRLNTLTAAIAHEFNQPLAAILSNAQAGLQYMAGQHGTAAAMRDILEAVVRDGRRAAETVRSMRALMRSDETRRERVDVAVALEDARRLLSSELVAHEVRCEIAFEAGCWVVADQVQIEQVALNLLLNAAKAVQDQAPHRRAIRLEVVRRGDACVRMSVRDSGKGIAPNELEAIFEPFWTTRPDGLGLGLAICRSIVEAHGGRIWAEPNPLGGAVFSVELPQAVALPVAVVTTGVADVLAAGGVAPIRIRADERAALVCVVDDDRQVRESLLRLLDGAGLPCAGFASAEEFLHHPPRQEIACMLIDVQMPGQSGLQLHQRLRELGGAAPVIFISGGSDVAAGVAAMKGGAVDFLQKPVDGDILLAALRRAAERHAGQRRDAMVQLALKERIARLSPREHEIMNHVVQGRLNKQIAADLAIAEQTVKQHRGRVMEKMGVRSVAALVRAFESAGSAAPVTLDAAAIRVQGDGDPPAPAAAHRR